MSELFNLSECESEDPLLSFYFVRKQPEMTPEMKTAFDVRLNRIDVIFYIFILFVYNFRLRKNIFLKT